ncbi:hypothetical protein EKO04_008759 [Ascochyta lentis]|uniref:AB hydrolase-1 domain-containing protein n=1 Tax=Ascochyta lentis TaxID=205686 RepID=A0A8H7IXE5_9PLEO|nr:hypothetical protein EKO04_008759 [Ascochyta lentis]
MKPNTIFYSALAMLVNNTTCTPLFARQNNVTSVSSFDELTPSADIVWTPCFENFTCSLLEVPLDYSNHSVGTVNLAITKKPGDSEDAREVLLNSGGPGGSSVAMVISDYETVQSKIGAQYSLIGIDPRGMANSGPSSDRFPGSSSIARNAFLAEIYTPPDITSDYALRQNHEYMRGYGQWCSSVYAVNNTAKYASTVATAQDMLHYIELRAKSKGEPPEEAKLWYYGISYGTILGGTFASLYPDRIGRMIIDSVMDLEDHYNGGWEKSIVDNDEAARYLFKRCFEAGPKLCQFHQNATSWEELERRYTDIMYTLVNSPIGVGDHQLAEIGAELGVTLTPTLFTWRDLVNYMFTTAYLLYPASHEEMDVILMELQTGVVQLLAAASVKSQISSTAPGSFVENMHNASLYGGLNTVYQSGPICSHLDVSPPKSQVFDGVPRVPSTSAPILLISMLLDPVTPLPAARKMHSLFPGSGLLIGNNSGHCAHFQKSECLSTYEKQYMLDGTLPPPDTTCEVDQPNPFLAVAEQSKSTMGGL